MKRSSTFLPRHLLLLTGFLGGACVAFSPASIPTTRQPRLVSQRWTFRDDSIGDKHGGVNRGNSLFNNTFDAATFLLDHVNEAPPFTYLTNDEAAILYDPLTVVAHAAASGETVSAVLNASAQAVVRGNEQALLEFAKTDKTILPVSLDEAAAAPSVNKILKFAVPAIGVWLCSPILSLIDTSAVGILSGTVHQAALNPAVAVTDYAALLIAFLYTGTTNLMAAAKQRDMQQSTLTTVVDESPLARSSSTSSFIGAMQLSCYVGLGLGVALMGAAPILLRAIIGNSSVDPAIMAAALKYVRIRALGMPAAAVIGSAQAACLGMQDVRSPLYVLGVAAGVNFVGDCLFVGSKHAWIGGAAGAAWATVFSQYAAVFMFMHWLGHKSKAQRNSVLNVTNAVMELTSKKSRRGRRRLERVRAAMRSLRSASGAGKPRAGKEMVSKKLKEKAFTVRGFLDGKFKTPDLLKLPSKAIVNDFRPYILPVTATQVGRVSGYVAMSHVVSSSLGYVSMAAQQVIVSLFYCLCPIADSLSLTAQSFVPAISERPQSRARAQALRQTIKNFYKASGVFGAAMVAAGTSIPILSGFFTADPAVVSLVNLVTPLLCGIFAVHGFVCAGEGLLLAQKDLSFLGRLYAGFFAVVPFFMLRVKRAALSGDKSVNLTSIWKVFLCYQLFRFGAWTVRVGLLQRRSEKAAAAIEL